ncbi:DUF805 domain-containing protein [Marinihelvus fidelis]|uniref:DUF805 domain-containing protein n=1 Tax=Marinihelvus fidelis TaxID=2613842 RepID=A0A5N0TGY8_9GAMM|nr:DUF805 domain-containing protein [Marinihelvus fidelis]KAA9133407.1 DUF805 domain-containing protein [Marinihelvus fidelis]
MNWYLTVLKKYAQFSGRSRRSEIWWFILFNIIVTIVLSIIDNVTGTTNASGYGILGTIYALAVLLPSIAVGVRRLHDTGKTGWWILIGLVPFVGWIVLIVFYCIDSEPGTNQYGPNPKGVG